MRETQGFLKYMGVESFSSWVRGWKSVGELGFRFPQEVLEDKGVWGYFTKFGNREVDFKD